MNPLVLAFVCKNSVNVIDRSVGMLLSPHALKPLNMVYIYIVAASYCSNRLSYKPQNIFLMILMFEHWSLLVSFCIWGSKWGRKCSIFTQALSTITLVILRETIVFFLIIWCEFLLDIGMMVRVFANGPGDLSSIPGWVIPKSQKMVLDASLLNTKHYKVRVKGKVEQSRERSSALPYTLV